MSATYLFFIEDFPHKPYTYKYYLLSNTTIIWLSMLGYTKVSSKIVCDKLVFDAILEY